MKSIAVYCASSKGFDPQYETSAYEVGKYIASLGMTLVYGGANVGLMGAVANGAIENGGEVIGVLPNFLKRKEIEHLGLKELILVESMHERKMKMHELSDAIITLPGSFGTMEELFEMLTWRQLGLHEKPMGLLNTNQFYAPLIEMIDKMIASGFLKASYKDLMQIEENIDCLIEKMQTAPTIFAEKWIQSEKQV